MIRINLLPVRQTRKMEAARREFVLAVTGGVLTVLLVAGVWSFFKVRQGQLEQENAALQAEIDRLAADVARVDEMEKFKAELERKLGVIGQLRDAKAGPVHMLDDLANATPERLFLTEIEERGGEIALTGVAVTNEVISQFLRALDASPYFESVYLQDIEAMPPEKNLSVTLKKFKLTARLVTPKPVEKKDAPAAAGAAPAAPGGGT
ncbi:MAG: PilN domain-containing protein [Myxococcota bacterium]